MTRLATGSFSSRKDFLTWIKPMILRADGRLSNCRCDCCRNYNRGLLEANAVMCALDGDTKKLRRLAKMLGLLCKAHVSILKRETRKLHGKRSVRKNGVFASGKIVAPFDTKGGCSFTIAFEVVQYRAKTSATLTEIFEFLATKYKVESHAIRDAYYKYVIEFKRLD